MYSRIPFLKVQCNEKPQKWGLGSKGLGFQDLGFGFRVLGLELTI